MTRSDDGAPPIVSQAGAAPSARMSNHRRPDPWMRKAVLGVGLAVVAVAALLMSFTSLQALAALCGYSPAMANLLPVLLDAGAGVATYSWLAADIPDRARRFAKRLALTLLSSSVALNALGHGMVAAGVLVPPWWVVVLVSALAPAILGACVHLVGLQNQPGEAPGEAPGATLATPGASPLVEPGATLAPAPGDPGDATPATPGDQQEPGATPPGETITASLADQPGDQAGDQAGDDLADQAGDDLAKPHQAPTWRRLAIVTSPTPNQPGDDLEDRARHLVAEGAGRGRLAKELDLTESQARALLAKVKTAEVT